jgi:NAD(P)-dependent dehydrogenase (short-subunit alcohol dehydrogenase family)
MHDGSTAVVTGAASGIGLALAGLLAEGGRRLCLLDIDGDSLDRVAADLDSEVAAQVDVADPEAMERFAVEVGTPELLCLNAGVLGNWMGAPWEASPQEWQRVLGVNLLGVVNGLRSFVPRMLGAGAPGHILITASLAGAATWPGGGPYAASKHAVLAVAEQAALELADSNIGVTVICPALVRSAMSDEGDDPREVALEALAAVEERRFAVLPQEWFDAVELRATNLVSGAPPETPAPS